MTWEKIKMGQIGILREEGRWLQARAGVELLLEGLRGLRVA